MKAVKVACLAAQCNVLVAPHSVLSTLHCVAFWLHHAECHLHRVACWPYKTLMGTPGGPEHRIVFEKWTSCEMFTSFIACDWSLANARRPQLRKERDDVLSNRSLNEMILDKSLEWFLSWLASPNPIHVLYFGLNKIKYD